MSVCAPPRMKGPNVGVSATGTRTGYDRHLQAGEKPCRACVEAAVALQRTYKEKRRKPPKRKPKPSMQLPAPRHEPAFVGSEVVWCACGARGRVNKGLLKRGQRKITSCVECR